MSQVHGLCEDPPIRTTIGSLLQDASRCRPNLEAFVFTEYNQTITYKSIAEKTNDVAKGLISLGVKSGDRVVVLGCNGQDWLSVFFATVSIGAIYNAPYLYKPKHEMLGRILEKLGCSVVVLMSHDLSHDADLLWSVVDDATFGEDSKIISKKFPSLKYVLSTENVRGAVLLSTCVARGCDVTDDELHTRKSTVTPDQPAVMLMSTGSTGFPSFPLWSHFAFVNMGNSYVPRLNLTREDTIQGCQAPNDDDIYPLGCIMTTLLTYQSNNKTVFFPKLRMTVVEDCDMFMQVIQDYRINVLYFYPHLWISFFIQNEGIEKFDLTSLRGGVTAGWKIQPDVCKPLIERVPEFVVCYCCSEYFPITINFPDDDIKRKCATVGYPAPHTEIKLIDDERRTVPIGDVGEVCVRGPYMFSGYWGNPKRTSEVLDAERWYHTGDLCQLGEEGFLTFIGRKSDSIRFKVWGDVVYPGYIEDAARTHGSIAEAKVVGLPNDLKGSDVVLCVVMKPGHSFSETAIHDHLSNKLTDKDIPDFILQFDHFPKIGSRRKIKTKTIEEMVAKRMDGVDRKTTQEYADQFTS